MSKKPKPATAGTKIADEHAAKITACGVRMLRDHRLACRIDAALRRERRAEHNRWWKAVNQAFTRGELTWGQCLAIRAQAEGRGDTDGTDGTDGADGTDGGGE